MRRLRRLDAERKREEAEWERQEAELSREVLWYLSDEDLYALEDERPIIREAAENALNELDEDEDPLAL